MINEEMHWLQTRMDQSKGRVFWRSFSEGVHSAPLVWLNPTQVDDKGDRVGMYWSTWFAKMDGSIKYDLRTSHWASTKRQEATTWSMLVTGVKIVLFPLLRGYITRKVQDKHKNNAQLSDHQSKMEAFYESQKNEYDSFREQMLYARPVLAECLPLRKLRDGKLVWVDVGGGTARNLEFFSVDTIRANFSKIVVVDVSMSLLEVARKRVEAAGLTDIVECIECDFCNQQAVSQKLPKSRTCDLVTFSYSLSMIPDKKSALKSAVSLLKPQGAGVLGIADFFYGGGKRASYGLGDEDGITNIFTRIYCEFTRLWFKQDSVILLKEEVFKCVQEDVDLQKVPQERFRKRVPLLPLLRPWHGVLVAPTK
jgi:ubiquinone/menaquinone biosynthesis C-methylase UbiE